MNKTFPALTHMEQNYSILMVFSAFVLSILLIFKKKNRCNYAVQFCNLFPLEMYIHILIITSVIFSSKCCGLQT